MWAAPPSVFPRRPPPRPWPPSWPSSPPCARPCRRPVTRRRRLPRLLCVFFFLRCLARGLLVRGRQGRRRVALSFGRELRGLRGLLRLLRCFFFRCLAHVVQWCAVWCCLRRLGRAGQPDLLSVKLLRYCESYCCECCVYCLCVGGTTSVSKHCCPSPISGRSGCDLGRGGVPRRERWVGRTC